MRERVGDGRVICGLSGGVDSAVVAALLAKAIGPQLTCILVDNGLLRKDEETAVVREFSEHFQTDLHVVKAAEPFPCSARRRHRAAGEASPDRGRVHRLLQGGGCQGRGRSVPRPRDALSRCDRVGRIARRPRRVDQAPHNVGGLPKELGFELVEPLRDLFKDEVRRLGLQLRAAGGDVWRHPFPGPGLAVRCLGEVTAEKLATLREADDIVVGEIKAAGLYRERRRRSPCCCPYSRSA